MPAVRESIRSRRNDACGGSSDHESNCFGASREWLFIAGAGHEQLSHGGYAQLGSGRNLGSAAGNMYNTPGNASVGAGSPNPSMAAATAMVGDRYASTMMADPNAAAGPMPPEYRSSSTPLGAGTGYQPAAGVTIPGNTGYNPPDAYSTPAGTGSAGAAAPPQEYRPGGTSNYVPTGSSVQPTGGNGTDSSATMGGVRPASYQGSAGGVKTAGFTTSAGIPATTRLAARYMALTKADRPAIRPMAGFGHQFFDDAGFIAEADLVVFDSCDSDADCRNLLRRLGWGLSDSPIRGPRCYGDLSQLWCGDIVSFTYS